MYASCGSYDSKSSTSGTSENGTSEQSEGGGVAQWLGRRISDQGVHISLWP